MEDQLGALGLGPESQTLWNTKYLDDILNSLILNSLRAQGHPVLDADAEREEYRDSDNNTRSRRQITADKIGHALPYLKRGEDTGNISTDQ